MVGGGFAGRRAYQLLVSRFDTQLIDAKGYYEYTPANLRCLVEPVHAAGTVQEQPAATLVDIVTDVLHNGELSVSSSPADAARASSAWLPLATVGYARSQTLPADVACSSSRVASA